jgi:hypothetical protein
LLGDHEIVGKEFHADEPRYIYRISTSSQPQPPSSGT